MNDELELDENIMTTSKPKRVRFSRKKKETVSSRFGYATFAITTAMIVLGIILSGGLDNQSSAQAVNPPLEALNTSALSAAWTCPIAGVPSQGDSLLITNSDPERTAQVNVLAYSPAGAELGKKEIDIKSESTADVSLASITSAADASVYIESFSGAVSVFRSLNLSDGQEFVRCDVSTSQKGRLLGLSTVREANAVVVLANPYDQAVVVDMTATLVDTATQPARTVLDENRGIIIPAHGRTSVDTQAEFGRYPLVNIAIESRSGFFSVEAIQTFTGANGATGQSAILSSAEMNASSPSFVPGIAPTRIVGYNNDSRTHSVTIEAFAADKRYVTLEPQTIGPVSSATLAAPGEDFGVRTLSFAVEQAGSTPRNMFVSWMRATSGSVSSGDSVVRKSNKFVIPATAGDTLYIYNANKKESNVTISYSTIAAKKNVVVSAQSYVAISLDLTVADISSILSITSSQQVFIGAGDESLSRYTSGINLIS